jgi:hypothetical protein
MALSGFCSIEDTSKRHAFRDVLTELDHADKIEQIATRARHPLGHKKPGFIAGADINEFRGVTDPAKSNLIARESAVPPSTASRLPLPTMRSFMDMPSPPGGARLRHHRDRNASFGTEVLLGLHPGLGGTLCLASRLNPVQAMTMMLAGKPSVHPRCRHRYRRCGHPGAACGRRNRSRCRRLAESTGPTLVSLRPTGAHARTAGTAHALRNGEKRHR